MAMTVALLAGGRSTRFGGDKRFAAIHGRPLLQHMIEKLETPAGPIVLSVKDSTQWKKIVRRIPMAAEANLRVVFDPPKVDGPIAGLLAILRAIETPSVVVAAVDLPRLDMEWMSALNGHHNPSHFDLVVTRSSRGIEPLVASYGKGCLPVMERFALKGGRSVERFIDSLDAHRVLGVDLPTELEPTVLNVNTKEDLAQVSEPTPTSIHVRFYARARELAGVAEVDIPIRTGLAVPEFRKCLSERFPRLNGLERSLALAIVECGRDGSASIAGETQRLVGGEEILVLPPVSGG